jgi:hypothetical protein
MVGDDVNVDAADDVDDNATVAKISVPLRYHVGNVRARPNARGMKSWRRSALPASSAERRFARGATRDRQRTRTVAVSGKRRDSTTGRRLQPISVRARR